MITAQEIREKEIDTVRIGGYDRDTVDDFLEELADEFANAQKENAVLKSKMKVLVDKIEEYRANEEALNLAVVSAQKLAVQIEADARARAQAMLADADRQVCAKIGGISELADAEEKRLADAKAASAKYFEDMRKLCSAQLEKIENIRTNYVPEKKPEANEVASQSAIEDTVRSIENNVARIQPEASLKIELPDMDLPAYRRNGLDSTQPFTL